MINLANKPFPEKKENTTTNFSIDNYEAESNLDLTLGESFQSNFNAKETNIPNSSMSPNVLIINTQKIPQVQAKPENNLNKILNTNVNNSNALNINKNNTENLNLKNMNMNINLNNIQQNLLNNLSQSHPSNFGNFSSNKNLEKIKEHHLENETDDLNAESLESKVNKYNLSMNNNDIRSKSITNPSFFMNRNDEILNANADKANQNRIEILVKNNKIDNTNLDSISNKLSAMATPSMKIDEILTRNNISAYNNNSINNFNNSNINVAVSNEETAENKIPSSAYAVKDCNFGIDVVNKIYSAYTNNESLEAPKKLAFQNAISNSSLNKETIANNAPAASGSSIDDILKKYGIKIDENTAEVLPLNNKNDIAGNKKEEAQVELKTENFYPSFNADNSNKNINSDFESIRKSIVKLKETDLATLQKELIEKENVFDKKKDENVLNELKKEDYNTLTNKKESAELAENKIQKSDSFSSKVQKILESGDKKNNNNSLNYNNNYDLAYNQQRNTSFQLQHNSNKTVMFNLEQEQNATTNYSHNNQKDLLDKNNNNNNYDENSGIKKTAYQPTSNININDNHNSANAKNQVEESEDWESRSKEKVKRNSGIFMKRAKFQSQEKDDLKPNSDTAIPESNRKSTYNEKLISTYINELNEEDEEISRIRRNTNLPAQNKLNLNSINFNSSSSTTNANTAAIKETNYFEESNINNDQINQKQIEEIFESNKTRNSTDIKINKRNINLIINEINEQQETEVILPDTAKGKRVSGIMKRPNAHDLMLEEQNNQEETNTEKDNGNTKKIAKENFMKKLNANILKRGNYKDNEDSESNDENKKNKNKFSKKNSHEKSENSEDFEVGEEEEEEEIESNSSALEEIEEEVEESENDEIKELDEEYESEVSSDEENINESKDKKKEIDALDDVYLNHILTFTEKEIKKNKELTEENSRKNSSITVFNFFYFLKNLFFNFDLILFFISQINY